MAFFRAVEGVLYAFEECCSCGTMHAFEKAIYDAAKQRLDEMDIVCPNGHSWHYTSREPAEANESEEEPEEEKSESNVIDLPRK